MRPLLMVVGVLSVIGVLSGCSSGSTGVTDVENPGDLIRVAASDDLVYAGWHDPNDQYGGSDHGVGLAFGWGYVNKEYDTAEVVTNAHVNNQIHIVYQNGTSWSCGGTIDVGDDVDGHDSIDGDQIAIVGITGFRSTSAGTHTPSRMLVTFGDLSQNAQAYVAVYRGVDTATRWSYMGTWDLYADGYYSPNYSDLDIAPDGQYLVVATEETNYFVANIWDVTPTGTTIAGFIGSHKAEIDVLSKNDYYGGGVEVEMGANYHNAYDHNIVCSIPGAGTIKTYSQTNDTTWASSATKTDRSSPAILITNEGYQDHLFIWDEGDYWAEYYLLSSTAAFGSRLDTFGAFGLKTVGGGINGISYLAGDTIQTSSSAYFHLIGIQSAYDGYIEMFDNY